MSLPRFNIGTRFNTISSSLNTFYRSFTSSNTSASDVVHVYAVSGTSKCVAVVQSGSTYIGSPTVVINAGATASVLDPVLQYTVIPEPITCGATVTAESVGVSGTLCTATVTAEASVVCYADGLSITNVYAIAKTRADNEIYIAAYNSPVSDKLIADYICTGISDQTMINTIVASNKIAGLSLLFARGTFKCDGDIEMKNVDVTGYGAGATVFDFTGIINGIVARTTGTTSLNGFSVTGSGTLTLIYDDPKVAIHTNKFIVGNVTATNYGYGSTRYYNNATLGKIMVEMAYPTSTVVMTETPEVYLEMHNCIVSETDYSGFVIRGEAVNDSYARMFKDIYIYNCHTKVCGKKERNSVVAGFHLLENISTENIRIVNSTAVDNWHSGFYFDDARLRTFVAYRRSISESNIVRNLYMVNCEAYSNGKRSIGHTPEAMLPYCSGFVLREFGKGSDLVETVPDFITVVDYNKVVTVPQYPAFLGDARGSYEATDTTRFAYGNITNCISSNNRYAGFYSRGYKWNAAELNLKGCISSECQYAFVIDSHDGIRLLDCVSSRIGIPSVILKSVDTITVHYMRIDDPVDAQYITFNDMTGCDLLPVGARKFIEAVE